MADPDVIKNQREKYEQEWNFVSKCWQLICDQLSPMAQLNSNVINFVLPQELEKKLDLQLPTENGENDIEKLVEACGKIVKYSVKTGNPLHFNTFYHMADPYGMAATFLIEALHSSVYNFDVAPALTLVEREVVQSVVKLVGWKEGDGIFTPGGSTSNMFATNIARYAYDNNIKSDGMINQKRLIIFASDQCHYSVRKAASFLGLGTKSVVNVKSDDYGRMDVHELKLAIQSVKESTDSVPLMVWCMSGTTVLNAFDPLSDIQKVCQEFKIWLHVDACFGGDVLFSDKLKHLLAGVEKTDSMSWNWHKIIGAPYCTSIFVTRHKNLLSQAHSDNASYLFLDSKYYDTAYDSAGDATIQCGRKGEALKVWLMWKARGPKQIGHLLEQAYETADYCAKQMSNNPRFRNVFPENKAQGASVCFWIIPPSLQNEDPGTQEYKNKLNKIAPIVKERLVRHGDCVITFSPIECKDWPNLFRWTFVCHPLSSREEIAKVIDLLTRFSNDL